MSDTQTPRGIYTETDTLLGIFTLRVELGNAAMSGPNDLAAALRKVADQVEQRAEYPLLVRDSNGNAVGEWTVTPA